VTWTLAPARALGRAIDLGADNEDWEIRGERLRREAEDAEKRRKAAEEAERKKKADAEEQRKRAEEEAKKKKLAEEEAKKKAEEARKKAAEEEARKKKLAEDEAKKRAEDERKKKAAEEAEKKKQAEEAEKKRREAAELERKKKEAEEKVRKDEEERIKREAAESEQRAKADEERAQKETKRPSLGGIFGARAGEVVRIDDAPVPAVAGATSVVWLSPDNVARLYVPKGRKEKVNGKDRDGVVNLAAGDLLTVGEDVFVHEERAELENVSAPSVHFARNDDKPGGPWAYWNEPVVVGAARTSAVNVLDDGVEDQHAKVFTRFGRVVLEDLSGPKEGVFIKGQKVARWTLLEPDMTFRLGQDGPELKVVAGAAELKPKLEKAAAMKPSRNTRTVLDITDKGGGLVRRVFMFSRREVRFGNKGRSAEGKMLNELVLVPAPGEEAEVAEKQGGLTLTRDGLEIRRDGGAAMTLDDVELVPGKGQLLKRGFELIVGDDLVIDGRAYRSPSTVELGKGPPQLGMKGGHPLECVRMDRLNLPHTYVFLVRMLRIGSEAAAPLRLQLPGVMEHHAQIIFVDGKFQIVATHAGAKVKVGEVELEPGVPTNLAIDTAITLGQATLTFRDAEDSDFQAG
jgi:hypothetical protein